MRAALISLTRNWKQVALVITLIGVGATTASGIRTVRDIPKEMEIHNSLLEHHDSVMTAYTEWVHANFGTISENQSGPLNQISRDIKEVRKIEQQQLCLQVALLRRSDWTKCLVE